MALRDVINTRPTSPYFRPPPLHIAVVAIKEAPRVISWDFSNDSATPAKSKNNVTVAITDGDSAAKVTLYEEFASKIKEEGNYIMRGYTLRGGCPPHSILIKKDTIFFKSSPVSVSESLRREALLLLDPVSTAAVLPEVPAGCLITLEGVVTDLPAIRRVHKGGEDVPLRSLRLKQDQEEAQINLWREAALLDVVVGASVRLTHLKSSAPIRGVQLNSTNFTKLEIMCDSFSAEVTGITQATTFVKYRTLLLADDRMFNISPDLWQPFDGELEKRRLFVSLKVCGKNVKEISFTEE